MDQSTEVGPHPGQVLLGSCLRGFQTRWRDRRDRWQIRDCVWEPSKGQALPSPLPGPRSLLVPMAAVLCYPGLLIPAILLSMPTCFLHVSTKLSSS